MPIRTIHPHRTHTHRSRFLRPRIHRERPGNSPSRRAPLATAALLLGACTATEVEVGRPSGPAFHDEVGIGADGPRATTVQAPASIELPADWLTCVEAEFERWLLAALPEGSELELSNRTLAELGSHLDSDGHDALRAVLVLARSGDPRVPEVFLDRLAKRDEHALRSGDSGDVVAAAALAQLPLRSEHLDTLADLVTGPTPHPDLEVSVEIASTLLEHGDDRPIAFLLRVLREQTPAQESPPTWTHKTTMFWAKSRASNALARRLGHPDTFRPDASVEDQAEAADRIEEALRNADVPIGSGAR